METINYNINYVNDVSHNIMMMIAWILCFKIYIGVLIENKKAKETVENFNK